MLETKSAPSLAEVRKLTDLGAINRLLQDTITRERVIECDLEQMLGQRTELESKLVEVHKSSGVLHLLTADADQMASSIKATCALAQSVSSKVRELDMLQSRVRATTSRISAITERTNCVDGLQAALDTDNFEQAATYISTFLQLDGAYLEQEGGDQLAEGASAEEQRVQLREAKIKLEAVVRQRFKEAAETHNHSDVVRFAKLYSPLGMAEAGLEAFCSYMRNLISTRAKEDFDALQDNMHRCKAGSTEEKDVPDFVGTLTNIFQDIAQAMQENTELLQESFGELAVGKVAQEMQKECDARASSVLSSFADFRRLGALSHEIARKGAPKTSMPDPREVEGYLEELLMLCQRSEEYNRFMLDYLKAGDAAGAHSAVNTFKTGAFNLRVQELIGYYISMEEYYMVENVSKAIQIDEVSPDNLTSSMVDDVFYILQKCATRTLTAGSVQCVCAGLNHVNNLLSSEYAQALQGRFKGPGRLLSVIDKLSPSTSPGPSRPPGMEFLVAVNSADVSADYVVKLRHELEGYTVEAFQATSERERIKSCLADLGETSTAFRQMTQQALEKLCSAAHARFKHTLEALAAAEYELTEAAYAANEVDDVWASSLVKIVETQITWLQAYLTGNNYDAVVQLLMDNIITRLEGLVLGKRFNQLGGLQLEREIRSLVHQLSAITSRTVRDKFARLTQISTILNLESVAEMLEYWGDNAPSMNWRLTPAEVRRVLGLRVEFKPEAINMLQL